MPKKPIKRLQFLQFDQTKNPIKETTPRPTSFIALSCAWLFTFLSIRENEEAEKKQRNKNCENEHFHLIEILCNFSDFILYFGKYI